MQKKVGTLLLLFMVAILNGCAYSVYDDQRLMGTMTTDKKLSAKIKTALLNESFTGGLEIAVYSFYGHVFLVGEVPSNMQEKALAIARRYSPRSITPHWFTKVTSGTSNFLLATKLRTALIGTPGLSSTRIDTEVNAGRAVLLGVVQDVQEKDLAIEAARKVQGIISVTSYLMLPQRAGHIDDFRQEQVSGVAPGGSASTVSESTMADEAGIVESHDLP